MPKVYYEEDDGQVLPTEQVHEGMQRELQLMKDLEVCERILRTDVPSGKKIFSTRWCHRRKGAEVRSRFVVRQFRDPDWETAFSGVPGLVVVRILLCISTILESCAVPGDFSVVFMSTPLHDAEFIEPPIEAENDSRYVWKLRKALSMVSRRHLNCFQTTCRTSWLISLVLRSVLLCPPLFYHSETDLRTAIHVDDPLTIGEVDTVMRFYDSLKQWLLVRVQDVVGSMKSSKNLLRGCVCTRWYDQLQIRCDTWSQVSRASSRFPGGETTQLRGTFNLPPRCRKVAIHCGTKARFVVSREGSRSSTCESA